MIRALTTAATGVEAQQANIERLSNDLANVNTDGFKRGRTEFHDLMYETIKEPGAQLGATSRTPVGVQVGKGVKVGATHAVFEQGPARTTYQPYDMMVEGDGFFPVQLPTGEIAYTRNGAFRRNAEGQVLMSNGALLVPNIQVPNNAKEFSVSPSGEVKVTFSDGAEQVLGQIQLVRFINPEGLSAAGKSLYLATAASGEPQQGTPNEDGFGAIMQGALEGSNVNVANTMVDMISTQRAYEMNTKVMSTADQMMNSLIQIK